MAEPTDLESRRGQDPPTRHVASIAKFSQFQGPLPPPELLERYNAIVPNGADRIVAMAEGQMRHRQSLESSVVAGNIKAQARGQILGFILGLTGILGGIGLIAFDKNIEGLTALITAFTALAGVFVYGRVEQRRERERKREELRQASENPKLPFEPS